ncbi:hypothetical protein [uncultured Brevundimonas sp.]|uniref:hypothetical protein n=1 Tax=uncultured Brevundimonas sp. TaxID=213418 RepID=UPI0030EF2B37
MIVWLGLGLLAGLAAAPGLAAGGAPLLPLFLSGLCLACAAHEPTRTRVMKWIMEAVSGHVARTMVIVAGATLLIQVLPLELALLMAGDVLAYVEVLAAVSLIAANTRLAPIRARAVQRIQAIRTGLLSRRAGIGRSIRAVRRPRRKPPRSDDAEGRAVWAFA